MPRINYNPYTQQSECFPEISQELFNIKVNVLGLKSMIRNQIINKEQIVTCISKSVRDKNMCKTYS